MKLLHVAILALFSLVATASPCGSDDFEQFAIQIPADLEQPTEDAMVDGAHDDWSDVELTATACTCAGRQYSTGYVDNSVKAAYRIDPHPTTDTGEYPHIFHNGEGLTCPCNKNNLLEFPLLMTGVYRPHRDQPGADRVVYSVVKQRGKDTLKYCGCMTHEGAPGHNRFIKCL